MSGDSNLAQGTWEEAEAMVGKTLAQVQGADPVSAADIRRKLEVVGLDCGLHYDAELARSSGYRTIVSPVSMLRTWTTPAYWKPGQALTSSETSLFPSIPISTVPGPGNRMFGTGTRTEFLAPVYPGDFLTATTVLTRVTRKSISVGDGAFIVVETTYTNQDGTTVALEELTVFRFTEDANS